MDTDMNEGSHVKKIEGEALLPSTSAVSGKYQAWQGSRTGCWEREKAENGGGGVLRARFLGGWK